jgi:UPF0716 protein FxsA
VFAAIALAFLLVPFVELFILLEVGQAIGALPTIGLLVVVSVVGAWLVKREGIAVLGRARAQVAAGHVPGRELVDGMLILFAGALLLTPGFVTDALGVALLLPPVRSALRAFAIRHLSRRVRLRTHRR